MAKVPTNRRVASNPHTAATQKKARTIPMNATDKKAFVARMAKARNKAKKNPQTRPAKKPATAKKKNPQHTPAKHHTKRKNPDVFAVFGKPQDLAINIAVALTSAVATRQIPQMILADANSGWKGYLANVATGVAATLAAHQFVSMGAAQAALLGSGVIVLDRVLTEKFSPVGKYLSLTGLGDATAATRLGEVSKGYYIHPTIRDAAGNPIIPHEFSDAALAAFDRRQLAAPAPPAGSTAQTTRQRMPSRFN